MAAVAATATYPESAIRSDPLSKAAAKPASPRTSLDPAPAREIPTDFRSSLAAWWSSSGYKDGRAAEDRLLRRLKYYRSPPPAPSRGWFASSSHEAIDAMQVADGSGLVATLRTVFIPTPDPSTAPLLPSGAEPPSSSAGSVSSSASSSKSTSKSHFHLHHKSKTDKLNNYVNTLEISDDATRNAKEAVVVLHGYAAALGFFFRNWDAVAHSAVSTGRRAFFLDWLGMGLSSRPSPSLLSSPASATTEQRVARAEHFFLSSLESWRVAEGIERMVLVGHSLGGYLATAYALRYPERVSSLVLVSPAGIPHGGGMFTGRGTAGGPQNSDPAARPTPVRGGSNEEAADAAEMEMADPKDPEDVEQAKRPAAQKSTLRRGVEKFFLWGWEQGMSPFSVLRAIGPWGPMLVGKYSARRFHSQSPEDVRDLHAYIWGTTSLKGSGEYCISHLLAPGAYARMPIVDRIGRLRIPVTFMYGDNDWMDVKGGLQSKEILAKAGNNSVDVHVVPGAGHHVYLDNAEESNRLIDRAIRAAPAVQA